MSDYTSQHDKEGLAKSSQVLERLTTKLNDTKSRMRAVLSGLGTNTTIHTESVKTYDELSEDNVLLMRRCEMLENLVQSLRAELKSKSAQQTFYTTPDHATITDKTSSSSDARSIGEERSENLEQSMLMRMKLGEAEARLSEISEPDFKLDYAIRRPSWADSVDVDMHQWNLRKSILRELSDTLRSHSAIPRLLRENCDLPWYWANNAYVKDRKSKDLILDTSISAIQTMYDDLAERRMLSFDEDVNELEDIRWSVISDRRADKTGNIIQVWSSPGTRAHRLVAEASLDDPPVDDENVARELKELGYTERGWPQESPSLRSYFGL
ncbi:hypothetical protein V866_007848 [Kwoniella sp. B9012]